MTYQFTFFFRPTSKANVERVDFLNLEIYALNSSAEARNKRASNLFRCCAGSDEGCNFNQGC
jgi:hypothetical protein